MLDVTTTESTKDSLRSCLDSLNSGSSLIFVQTDELTRTLQYYRSYFRNTLKDSKKMYDYNEWSYVTGSLSDSDNGFVNNTGKVSLRDQTQAAIQKDFCGIYKSINSEYIEELNSNGSLLSINLFVIPKCLILNDGAMMQSYCEWYANNLSMYNKRIIVLHTEDLPEEFYKFSTVVKAKLPSLKELSDLTKSIFEEDISDEDLSRQATEENVKAIANSGTGMTMVNYENVLSKALLHCLKNPEIDHVSYICDLISEEKAKSINKNGVLELYKTESMENVGGLKNLKAWINQRKNSYTEEAKNFGVSPPRGIMLAGIPGTGKSLSAKAIASELKVPLVRLDFGKIFDRFVGSSEKKIRETLNIVESLSPCVLFIDEIDKAMAGIGSSSDSGTSARVLGTFLSWLQDNKYPVFTVVTANNIRQLPPELLRKGRFDAIFAGNIPNEEDRVEVLRIHCTKRGHKESFEKFTEIQLKAFQNESLGYTPAEIEYAVENALTVAFNANDFKDGLKFSYVLDSIKEMVPLTTSHSEEILEMQGWMDKNAIPAN